MDEGFELPVHFNGKELSFAGKLHVYSYTQKIEIDVNGTGVLYERDDEGEWRAIVDPTKLEKNKSINTALLQAIANAIENVLK
jgi:hypothetical protein